MQKIGGECKMSQNKIIVIAGPTASGKSALAIDVALSVNGVIINSDSMQVYKHMPIITACPNKQDKSVVEHRLFEIYEPDVKGNVVDWLNLATEEIKSVWQENKIPLIVGGTGLYIDNLINGTTPIPETPPEFRKKIALLLKEKGTVYLHNELKKVDKESALKISPNDTTRLSRALEVFEHTKIPLSVWHKKPMIKKLPEAEFFVIKICPPTEELDAKCYLRFDKMIELGALDEIRFLESLNLDEKLPSMRALGVPELLEFIRGNSSLETAVQNAKLHTRQYAKRQRTWFKNKLKADFELLQCYTGNFDEVKQALEKF
ncbi:MAG: tRNA (adenosine(37)-N6)-dimethylallyltransferase MiaA [Alphaproteobacteria bacterium]|nr:tRNA (adenosine(37)-N6)-dimethylallyltransferase MiaA [Alphaproteobacteria bacterium]